MWFGLWLWPFTRFLTTSFHFSTSLSIAARLRSPVFLPLSLSAFLTGIALIKPSTLDAFNFFSFSNSSLHLEFEEMLEYIISFVRIFYISLI
jgi:hypothetical protein